MTRKEFNALFPPSDLTTDAGNFLEALLFTLPEDEPKALRESTIHDFHPEFVAAVDSFCSAFRHHLNVTDSNADHESLCGNPDFHERPFGENVYFSLSGHGVGFWDASEPEGDAIQAALEHFAGSRYSFKELECVLHRFKGKIHVGFRTANHRREHLVKLFTPANP